MTLYDTNGTTVLGTATADGSGNWSITSYDAVGRQSHPDRQADRHCRQHQRGLGRPGGDDRHHGGGAVGAGPDGGDRYRVVRAPTTSPATPRRPFTGSGAEAGATVTLYRHQRHHRAGHRDGGRLRQLVDHQLDAVGRQSHPDRQADRHCRQHQRGLGRPGGDDRHHGGGAVGAGPDGGDRYRCRPAPTTSPATPRRPSPAAAPRPAPR